MKSSKRALLVVSALAALLPFGAPSVEAAVVTRPDTGAAAGMTTAFDLVIDLIVQQRVAAEKLSAADARVAREQLQLQFLSLTNAEQQSVLAAAQNLSSQRSVLAVMRALNNAVSDGARQALADVQAADNAKLASGQAQGMQPKLGPGSPDLVFIATVGPCRVFDSRNGPGPLAGFAARQIWGYSDNSFYMWSFDQGGTGQAGSGNCAGTVYGASVRPVSVVATVAVVNTFSTGSMRAWNGGTTLTVGGILGWNAGDVLSNTTVIPMDRFTAPYPGSGGKRDFGVYNNSPTPVDLIVDVVGYFIENEATALQCTIVNSATMVVPPNTWTPIDATCPAGYSATGGGFDTPEGTLGYPGVWTTNLPVSSTTWRTWVDNQAGGPRSIFTSVQCCRVPGR